MNIKLISLLLVVVVVSVNVCVAEMINTHVQRSIDLTSQLARHALSITVENKGSKDESKYTLVVQDEYQTPFLAYLRAEENGVALKVEQGKSSANNTEFIITFSKPLEKDHSTKLYLSLVFGHTLKPFPTHISQQEHQLVRYFDNVFFFSPYKTSEQKTTVTLASNNIEDYSEKAPTHASGDKVTYGPYSNVQPLQREELMVHFESHAPFITVTKMVKDIEISHWGNLAVEEWLDVRHDGAVLKGTFSRFDFQRNPAASPSAVLELTEVLPAGASDVYYRDDIGNISTSTFRATSKGLELHLVPRFPLFGGWKNNFYLGYNLPLELYLSTLASDSSSYVLNASFAADLGNVYVEDYTVKIILPEGAKNAKVEVPFAVDSTETDRHYTYLDTTGRTVLVVHKKNVVREHNQYFQVHYTFSRVSMLQEPLLVAGAFFFFFLTIMFFVRFELSITKKSTGASDALLASALESFRKQILNPFRDEFRDLQKTENSSVADRIRVTIQKGNNVLQQVTKINPTVGDKLDELTGLMREQLEAQLDLIALEKEFKRAGGKGKTKYDSEKAEKESRLSGAIDDFEVTVDQLFS